MSIVIDLNLRECFFKLIKRSIRVDGRESGLDFRDGRVDNLPSTHNRCNLALCASTQVVAKGFANSFDLSVIKNWYNDN